MIAVEFQGPRDGALKLEGLLRSHHIDVVTRNVLATHLESRGTVAPDREVLVNVRFSVADHLKRAEVTGAEGSTTAAAVLAVIDRFKRVYGWPIRVHVVDDVHEVET